MAIVSFERRFHDLKYFEVGYFCIFLKFIINSRASLQNIDLLYYSISTILEKWSLG